MKERKILFFLIILTICLIVMILTIKKYVELKGDSVDISSKNTVEENLSENNIQLDNNQEIDEYIDCDNTEYIFEHEEETGDEKYTKEQLNNFNFNIDNVPNDISQYIEDSEEFNIKIKEYVYLNGLVDASLAKYAEYEITDDKILIIYNLNNQEKTNLYVSINIANKNSQIYDDY